jgi:SEC-C motif-containing protein
MQKKNSTTFLRRRTLHNRQDDDRKGTSAWSRKLDWQRLEVRNTEKGGPDDSAGTVEFLARYRKDSKAFDHHEIAEFVREDDRWYFKDGHAPQPVQAIRQGPKIGRNDPCSCGSGKKYKKCCEVKFAPTMKNGEELAFVYRFC